MTPEQRIAAIAELVAREVAWCKANNYDVAAHPGVNMDLDLACQQHLLSALAAAQQEIADLQSDIRALCKEHAKENARLTAERDKWQEDAMIYRREKGDAMTHMARSVQKRTDAEVRAESVEEQRDALRAALERLSAWCDDRRNAPTMTTLGMVQAQIQEALAALPAGTEGR